MSSYKWLRSYIIPFTLTLAQPMVLVLIGANVAGFILSFSAIHIIFVNRRLLPEPLRASWISESLMVVVSVFYVVMNLRSMLI